jgi:hypothetical protein
LEWRGGRRNRTVARIPLSASAGKRMQICGKKADFRDASAPGFAAAVVDDGFVGAYLALNRVG